MKIMSGE